MTPMRIASYNTRDFLDDADAAARVVRAIDPDVLCLQEVPRRLGAVTRVASFAARCSMFWTADLRGSGGTAVLTSLRVQVLGSASHRLAVPATQRRRGFATVRVASPGGGDLTVASIHLGLNAEQRHRHVVEILDRLGAAGELVVAGDLNEDETGRAWRELARRLRLISTTTPTYSSAHPRMLFDVVLASAGAQALPHREVDLDPADLRAASDHLPTWADVGIVG